MAVGRVLTQHHVSSSCFAVELIYFDSDRLVNIGLLEIQFSSLRKKPYREKRNRGQKPKLRTRTCFFSSLSCESREAASSRIMAHGTAESLAPRKTLPGAPGSGGRALES